jgi:hypothetical protein
MVNHGERKQPARVTSNLGPVEKKEQEALNQNRDEEGKYTETPDVRGVYANDARGVLSEEKPG